MSRLDTLASQLESDLFVLVERCGDVGFLRMRHRAPRPAHDAALTIEMRRSLLRGLRTLQADGSVSVIVLTSDSRRVFSAGVNIEAFGDALVEDTHRQIPSLAGLCEAVESSPKLVVAFIQGSCESWGLELALAAPFRITLRNARFAFPEVQLSIVPCGGGALRLTRLVGVRQALLMLCTGKTVTSREALALGLVDSEVSLTAVARRPSSARGANAETLTAGAADAPILDKVMLLAKGYALQAAQYKPFVPRARQARRIGHLTTNALQFAWMEHKIRDHAPRHLRAPFMCLQAVRTATRHALHFDAALEQEKRLFLQCMVQPECKAMQHVLRASGRTVTNWECSVRASLTVQQQLLPFQHAVVIGAGLLGTSVAFLLLQHGLKVSVVEIDPARRAAVQQRLTTEILAVATAHRKMSEAEARMVLDRLRVVGSHYEPFPAALAAADLVVECVSERASSKKNVFAHLDRICPRDCVFMTCTASMDIGELAAVTQRPGQVIGVQFYPPANMNPLVEVCQTKQTDVGVLRRVMALCDKLQKHVVLTRSSVGHVGTRIMLAALYQAYTMLEEGAFPRDVDKAMKAAFHFKTGIFELEDVIGLDATALARRRLLSEELPGTTNTASPFMPRDVFTVVDALTEDGLVGRKRGEGWYRYTASPLVNPERDAKDDETPLQLPSLSAAWNLYTWRPGTLLPQGHWQTLLATRDLAVADNRGPEHRAIKVSKDKNILRRDFTEDEMCNRIIVVMINEAAKLLAKGIATCAADIDCLSVYGYGFPAWKGGLLYYADRTLGIDTVIKCMRVYQNSVGVDAFPAPCEALLDMSRRQKTFASTFADSHGEPL